MIIFNDNCKFSLTKFLSESWYDFIVCDIALKSISEQKAYPIDFLYFNIIENARMNHNLLVEPSYNFELINSVPSGFGRNLRNSIESLFDLLLLISDNDYFDLLQKKNGMKLSTERYNFLKNSKYSDLSFSKSDQKKKFNIYYKAELVKTILSEQDILEFLSYYKASNKFVHPNVFQEQCDYVTKNNIIKGQIITGYKLIAYASWVVNKYIHDKGITTVTSQQSYNVGNIIPINPSFIWNQYYYFEQYMNTMPILIQIPVIQNNNPVLSPLL